MPTITIPERQLHIASRWTEVHVRKMMNYLYLTDRIHESFRNEFEYECEFFTVLIQVVPRCKYNEEWIPCVNERCESTTWMPRVLMYMDPYIDDVFFSLDMPNELSIPLLYEKFNQQKGERNVCCCGRMSRYDHFIASDQGKCNNCYIYGMVRGEACSICFEDDGKPWIKTSCNHYFHDSCWSRVEQHHDIRKCPLCRSQQDRNTIEKI